MAVPHGWTLRWASFDTVLMMGNNFGLFANPRRAKWMLRRLKRLTGPNARIVAESLDIYGTDKPGASCLP